MAPITAINRIPKTSRGVYGRKYASSRRISFRSLTCGAPSMVSIVKFSLSNFGATARFGGRPPLETFLAYSPGERLARRNRNRREKKRSLKQRR